VWKLADMLGMPKELIEHSRRSSDYSNLLKTRGRPSRS
jgi:hypothetical protein